MLNKRVQTSCNHHFIKHLSYETRLQTSSFSSWSTTRFTCTRCWLQIFCKLCLSEELNNLINIDRAVTALYSYVEFTHSLQRIEACIYTEEQQHFCIHAAIHIQHIHIYCKGTTQLLCIYRQTWCSKSIDFSLYQINLHASQSHIQWRHDTVFAHIHKMTATSLRMRCNSYTSHTHTHCKDMTQLLHIYTFMWCSKLIDFSLYQINLHALQSHTLQRHDTIFAHIHKMTATSLCTCCNSYTSHTYTLWRHDSAFAHLHICMMQ